MADCKLQSEEKRRAYNDRVKGDRQTDRNAKSGLRTASGGHEIIGLIVVALLILALIVVRYWRVLHWTR